MPAVVPADATTSKQARRHPPPVRWPSGLARAGRQDGQMVKVPDSTKSSLEQTLRAHARQRWPQLTRISIKHRAGFAYVTGHAPDGEDLPLCRLRYVGSASSWRFAIDRASHDDYEENFLPTGSMAGTPEQALDTACSLYLGDPTAWITPPTN